MTARARPLPGAGSPVRTRAAGEEAGSRQEQVRRTQEQVRNRTQEQVRMTETAITPLENMTHKISDILRKQGYRTDVQWASDRDKMFIVSKGEEVKFKVTVEATWIS